MPTILPIEVIYENGVFRPLKPIELPEGALGEVLIASGELSEQGQLAGNSIEDSPGQRAYHLLMEIAALPHTVLDGGTDIGPRHDDILYPKQGRMP